MRLIVILVSFLILLFTWHDALAWSGRGHHTICDTATFLVKNKELKKFLTLRPHTMGHLCNVPDIYWKSLGGEFSKEGNAGHFIDSEILPIPLKDFPVELTKIIADYSGKKHANSDASIRSIPHEMGSLWWRANQFFQRATAEKPNLKNTDTIKFDAKEEQNDSNTYNKAVYNFYVNLGLMGHFVGDAAQPYHSTDDYDGYAKGHGGLHGYYEEIVVAGIDYDLQARVVKEGKRLLRASKKEKFLTEKTLIKKMRALSVASHADLDLVLKADLLVKPSEQKEERGMKIRKVAERVPLEKTIKQFEPLVVRHMGRAAALLATLWEEAYLQTGSPQLSHYRSYRYPFTPEFVMPDYYEIKK